MTFGRDAIEDKMSDGYTYAIDQCDVSTERRGALQSYRKRVVSHACLCGVRLGYNPVQAASR